MSKLLNEHVALGPDSTDRLTAEAPKPPAKEGGGTLADVRIPSRAMDATDAAIVRGERADIAILLAAERRAWNAYASELAHQVIRETLAALGSKP